MLRHVRLNPRPYRAFVGQILHSRPLNPSLSSDDRRPSLSPTFRSPHLEKGTCNCLVAQPGSYPTDSPVIMHDKRPPTPMEGAIGSVPSKRSPTVHRGGVHLPRSHRQPPTGNSAGRPDHKLTRARPDRPQQPNTRNQQLGRSISEPTARARHQPHP
jgi:hypothetical protein